MGDRVRKKYFQELYKFDPSSKTYYIEVSLDNYDEVYDDWDPSPFKRRDIEEEFNDFIVDSSEDIPFNFNIGIILYLPEAVKDPKKEIALLSAYKNFYSYILERLNKDILNLHKKTISYLGLSILLLSIGYFYSTDNENLFLKVLHEGVFVGGWVFLWEFFTNIFMTTRELYNEHKLYKRLYHAEIKFVYNQ